MIRTKTLLLGLCILLLPSCHSEYISLMFRVHHGASWNTDSTMVAFIASTGAYRKATGISRFPDGGRAKFIMEDVSLYAFFVNEDKVKKLTDFNDLTNEIGLWRSNWKVHTACYDSTVYYQVGPVTNWDWYIKGPSTKEDSLKLVALKEKYQHIFQYDIPSGEVLKARPIAWDQLKPKTHSANLTLLGRMLDSLPVKELGLDIMEIYPKPKKEYISETIYLENDSPLARRAVIEQIISKLNREEIEKLLEKMDSHMNRLEGNEKTQFRIYSKETRKQIRELL